MATLISAASDVCKLAVLPLMLAVCQVHASGKICKQDVYIVAMSSARQIDHMGWAIMVSKHPYYDAMAEYQRTDKGYRVDINTDRGKALFDLALYAMNMGYKVDVVDNNGTRCDDFDELDVRRMPPEPPVSSSAD